MCLQAHTFCTVKMSFRIDFKKKDSHNDRAWYKPLHTMLMRFMSSLMIQYKAARVTDIPDFNMHGATWTNNLFPFNKLSF